MKLIKVEVKIFDWFDRTYSTKNLRTINQTTKN